METHQPGTIRRIHVIFKTHLDVGFTDFSAKVVENYFNVYIPKAIRLAENMRQSGSPDRFIWTTGSWLIYRYLERANQAERKLMETAIANGDIAWHALPFTTHSENMDASLFRFGLSLSAELDQRFGKHTLAAKMTDVPGHTRGIVPLLAEAGVQFLHIGVNHASTSPDTPPVFVWRDPISGADVMVMYHYGYGDLMTIPGMEDAIAFAHTGDNLGPQSPEMLHATYQAMRERFPGAEITASTMDAFAIQLAQVKSSLPVVTQEIGDTWIHGTQTDPTKEANYRELLRLRQLWIKSGISPSKLSAFSERLIQVPEHTWGLDVKTHLHDWVNYSAASFQSARSGENYRKMEASWEEQRRYLTDAVAALPEELKQKALDHLSQIAPHRPEPHGFQTTGDLSQPVQAGQFTVSFDPQTGAMLRLERDGVDWAGEKNPLGLFWYETFSDADYQRFFRQYNPNKRVTRSWAIPDFTKPGIESVATQHLTFLPHMVWSGRKDLESQSVFLFKFEMPEESWRTFGAPQQAWLEITLPVYEPKVAFKLQWFDKSATRLPEASWFSFVPRVRASRLWRMDKLGEWITPHEVIRNGNRHLHAIGSGVRYEDSRNRVSINTLDTALVAPGKASLLDFNNRQPDLRLGWQFNLHNNVWGTNFPMWYEDDACFRFSIRIEPVTLLSGS